MADKNHGLLPVIMSGGSGMRLWPLSRKAMPKQFQAITGGDETLLQQTMERVRDPIFAPPLVICHEDHRFIVQENATARGFALSGIILEPESKNTAAAVMICALWARKAGYKHLLVLPSDHVIGEKKSFQDDIKNALDSCRAEPEIIYFGITPASAHTGFGYIEPDNKGKVRSFHEKPDVESAGKLIAENGALWNSGIFLVPVDAFLEEMRALDHTFVALAETALENAQSDLSFLRLPKNEYAVLPSLSFDKAYCEKAKSGTVIKADFSWSDMGSWDSIFEHAEKNETNNVLHGNVVAENTTDSFISSDGILVGVIGINNAVIVATKDAILVSAKDKTQNVRDLVERIKLHGKKQADEYFIVYRPWGSYETVNETPGCRIIRMRIKPHGRLSLQSHAKRTEHWVVVSGALTVTKEDTKQVLECGESDFAHAGERHRLENTSEAVVEFIEVQTGIISDEDIERFDQVY